MSKDKHIPDYLREWFWSGNTLLYRIPGKRASDIILDCPDPIFAPAAEQKELIASAPSLKEENEKLRFQLEAIEGLTNERDSALKENEKLSIEVNEYADEDSRKALEILELQTSNKRLREALESILTLNEETRTSSPFKLTKFKDKVSDIAYAALNPTEDEN